MCPETTLVSIPFQRESISKVNAAEYLPSARPMFPFPSNGKAYPKLARRTAKAAFGKGFPFPSNGKAYPKGDNGEVR